MGASPLESPPARRTASVLIALRRHFSDFHTLLSAVFTNNSNLRNIPVT